MYYVYMIQIVTFDAPCGLKLAKNDISCAPALLIVARDLAERITQNLE